MALPCLLPPAPHGTQGSATRASLPAGVPTKAVRPGKALSLGGLGRNTSGEGAKDSVQQG